jgi:hypothetical protein
VPAATCASASGTGSVDQRLNVPAGETVTLTLTATVAADATGVFTNRAIVSLTEAAAVDPNPTNNEAADVDAVTPPFFSIGDAAVVEGNGPTTTATFTVTLSRAVPIATSVDYATADGTAAAPGDFVAGSGTLAFAAGETVKTVTVPVVGDLLHEASESFAVILSNPVNATLLRAQAQGAIVDDDTATVVVATRTLSATRPVGVGGGVRYTLILANSGSATQGDNAGPELVDLLPPELDSITVSASSGVATVSGNQVSWNGSLAPGGSVTVTIRALLRAGVEAGDRVTTQATVRYDADVDGTNEASTVTDDPDVSGAEDPTAFEVQSNTSVWHNWFAVNPSETPMVGDFDGDGRTDIVTFTRNSPQALRQVYVALSDGTRFVDRNGLPDNSDVWHEWFAIAPDESVVIGDYDGDGRDDIATWLPSTQQVYVALSTGTGFAAPVQWHSFFAVSTYERPRVADVDGDGLSDIVTFATDSPTAFGDVYVARSDGTKFVDQNGNANSSTKWHDWFAIRQTEEIRVGDLDGDRRQDFFTFLPPPFGQCYTVLSQGTAMGENVLWPEPVAPHEADRPFVGDVDGDGKSDVIVFAQSEGRVHVSMGH